MADGWLGHHGVVTRQLMGWVSVEMECGTHLAFERHAIRLESEIEWPA